MKVIGTATKCRVHTVHEWLKNTVFVLLESKLLMVGIELCKFTHGLGLYILRFYPSLSLWVKFEYKGPAHVYNAMPAMHYFLSNTYKMYQLHSLWFDPIGSRSHDIAQPMRTR